jgi:penicillin-binding protein 1A
VIWEAFKPESEPRRTVQRQELASAGPAPRARPRPKAARPQPSARDSEFLQDQGGIY